MSGALFSKRKLVAALAALGICGLEALLCELAVLDGCCGGFYGEHHTGFAPLL